MANIASVSPATVSRWTSGVSFPHPKTELLISDPRYVVDRLAELYDKQATHVLLPKGLGGHLAQETVWGRRGTP